MGFRQKNMRFQFRQPRQRDIAGHVDVIEQRHIVASAAQAFQKPILGSFLQPQHRLAVLPAEPGDELRGEGGRYGGETSDDQRSFDGGSRRIGLALHVLGVVQ